MRLIATDAGVDVLCAAGDAEAVRAALLAAGAVPADEAAAEIRRVETGRPRYGLDLDDSVIPQEAGLNDRAVSFTKGCYVGQETVARLYYRGKPNRHLRGLRLDGPAETGDPLLLGESEVGRLGSVVESPVARLDRPGAGAPRGRAGRDARGRGAHRDGGRAALRAGVDSVATPDPADRRATMASHVLVVATVTAASDDLLAALRERARARPRRLPARDARDRPRPGRAARDRAAAAGRARPLARRAGCAPRASPGRATRSTRSTRSARPAASTR